MLVTSLSSDGQVVVPLCDLFITRLSTACSNLVSCQQPYHNLVITSALGDLLGTRL